jgi:hypothetical protein
MRRAAGRIFMFEIIVASSSWAAPMTRTTTRPAVAVRTLGLELLQSLVPHGTERRRRGETDGRLRAGHTGGAGDEKRRESTGGD